MRLTFSEAAEAEFTPQLLYFYQLKMRILNRVKQHLCDEYGDGLDLRLFDENTIDVIEREWLSSDDPHISDRYAANSLRRCSVLPADLTVESISCIDSYPYGWAAQRFEVAIWFDGELCGLSYGEYSEKYDFTFVGVTEGSPNPDHPLKGHVKSIVDVASSYHASTMGHDRVCYFGPFSDGAKKQNDDLGLSLVVEKNSRCYARYIVDILPKNLEPLSNFVLDF